jgi:hypothetical protein
MTEVAVTGPSVVVALADRFEFRRIGQSGPSQIVRQPGVGRPVESEDRELLFGLLADGPVAAEEVELLRDLPSAATLPRFGREPMTMRGDERVLLTTESGAVWIRSFQMAPGPQRGYTFDANGVYEGPVEVPRAFQPMAILGKRILGVHRDHDEVESVRVYVVVPGG